MYKSDNFEIDMFIQLHDPMRENQFFEIINEKKQVNQNMLLREFFSNLNYSERQIDTFINNMLDFNSKFLIDYNKIIINYYEYNETKNSVSRKSSDSIRIEKLLSLGIVQLVLFLNYNKSENYEELCLGSAVSSNKDHHYHIGNHKELLRILWLKHLFLNLGFKENPVDKILDLVIRKNDVKKIIEINEKAGDENHISRLMDNNVHLKIKKEMAYLDTEITNSSPFQSKEFELEEVLKHVLVFENRMLQIYKDSCDTRFKMYIYLRTNYITRISKANIHVNKETFDNNNVKLPSFENNLIPYNASIRGKDKSRLLDSSVKKGTNDFLKLVSKPVSPHKQFSLPKEKVQFDIQDNKSIKNFIKNITHFINNGNYNIDFVGHEKYKIEFLLNTLKTIYDNAKPKLSNFDEVRVNFHIAESYQSPLLGNFEIYKLITIFFLFEFKNYKLTLSHCISLFDEEIHKNNLIYIGDLLELISYLEIQKNDIYIKFKQILSVLKKIIDSELKKEGGYEEVSSKNVVDMIKNRDFINPDNTKKTLEELMVKLSYRYVNLNTHLTASQLEEYYEFCEGFKQECLNIIIEHKLEIDICPSSNFWIGPQKNVKYHGYFTNNSKYSKLNIKIGTDVPSFTQLSIDEELRLTEELMSFFK